MSSIFTAPQKAFVTIGLIFGILFLLITPPFQAADEYNHYYRAFQISEGQIIAQKYQNQVGGFLPKSLVTTTERVSVGIPFNPEGKQKPEKIFSLFNFPLESNNRVFVAFPNTAVYSPIPYLPQIIGITFARIIGLSPILLMYVGRICNLLVWLVLGYLAIKITPICKWTFFLLALTPMSLFQAASLSADAVTNGVAFLLIAVFLQSALEPRLAPWYKEVEPPNSSSPAEPGSEKVEAQPGSQKVEAEPGSEKKVVTGTQIFIIFLLSVLLALAKQAYFPLVGLFLLIPVRKIGNKKKYATVFALLFLASVLAIFTWSFFSKSTYTTLVPNVAPGKQIHFILNHPFDLVGVILRTFFKDGIEYISQFVGKLGWLDTKLPPLFILSYLIMLVFVSLVNHRRDILISKRQKRILIFTLILNIILIASILYISWTPVGKDRILGLQGRYFIPIAPLLFLSLYNSRFQVKGKNIGMIIALYSIFSATLTVTVLLKRYYL